LVISSTQLLVDPRKARGVEGRKEGEIERERGTKREETGEK